MLVVISSRRRFYPAGPGGGVQGMFSVCGPPAGRAALGARREEGALYYLRGVVLTIAVVHGAAPARGDQAQRAHDPAFALLGVVPGAPALRQVRPSAVWERAHGAPLRDVDRAQVLAALLPGVVRGAHPLRPVRALTVIHCTPRLQRSAPDQPRVLRARHIR